jgi:hypothetical protein
VFARYTAIQLGITTIGRKKNWLQMMFTSTPQQEVIGAGVQNPSAHFSWRSNIACIIKFLSTNILKKINQSHKSIQSEFQSELFLF